MGNNMVPLPALIKPASKNGRRSPRCHFRNEECAAYLRAQTGVGLYRQGGLTLEEAAIRSGSCIGYLRAALILDEAIRQGWVNDAWNNQVIRGEIGVLAAARIMEPVVRLIAAFQAATPMAKRAFFRVTRCTDDLTVLLAESPPAERMKAAANLGVDVVWDQMVAPLVKAAE